MSKLKWFAIVGVVVVLTGLVLVSSLAVQVAGSFKSAPVMNVAGLTVSSVPAALTASANTAASGQHVAWSSFQGRPAFQAGKGVGVWVWNQNLNGQNTLYVFATTEGRVHNFSGEISTGPEGNFWDLDRVKLEADDHVTRTEYNHLRFDFLTADGVDGFAIKWSGRGLALNFKNDGVSTPQRVYYGAQAIPANQLPLLVDAGDEGLLTLPLSSLAGATNFSKGAGDGYWIYSDAGGIHLRTTTTSVKDFKYYTGEIEGQISNVALYKPEDDWLRFPLGAHQADFGLRTNGGTDGVDLTLNGASIVFTLRTDGHLASPNVSFGSNPFGLIHALTFRFK